MDDKRPEFLIEQPLFDSAVVVNAYVGDLVFFAVPTGQADNSGLVKSYAESNNVFSGTLPNGEIFDVKGISVSLLALGVAGGAGIPLTLATAQSIMEQSRASLQFRIDRKVFYEAPLFRFGSGHGFIATPIVLATDVFTNGVASPKATVRFKKVRLEEGRPFDVTVRFNAPTAVTEANGVRMYVFLNGMKKSPAYK